MSAYKINKNNIVPLDPQDLPEEMGEWYASQVKSARSSASVLDTTSAKWKLQSLEEEIAELGNAIHLALRTRETIRKTRADTVDADNLIRNITNKRLSYKIKYSAVAEVYERLSRNVHEELISFTAAEDYTSSIYKVTVYLPGSRTLDTSGVTYHRVKFAFAASGIAIKSEVKTEKEAVQMHSHIEGALYTYLEQAELTRPDKAGDRYLNFIIDGKVYASMVEDYHRE